jgi:hypothetical protein
MSFVGIVQSANSTIETLSQTKLKNSCRREPNNIQSCRLRKLSIDFNGESCLSFELIITWPPGIWLVRAVNRFSGAQEALNCFDQFLGRRQWQPPHAEGGNYACLSKGPVTRPASPMRLAAKERASPVLVGTRGSNLPQFAPQAGGSSRYQARPAPQYFAAGSFNSRLHAKEK